MKRTSTTATVLRAISSRLHLVLVAGALATGLAACDDYDAVPPPFGPGPTAAGGQGGAGAKGGSGGNAGGTPLGGAAGSASGGHPDGSISDAGSDAPVSPVAADGATD